MDMSLIKPIRLQRISIKVNDQFIGANYMDGIINEFSIHINSENNDIAYIFHDLDFKKDGLTDNFKLSAGCSWAFEIPNRKAITERHLYSIIEYTAAYLSNVLSTVYKEQKRDILVPVESFEDTFSWLQEKKGHLLRDYN